MKFDATIPTHPASRTRSAALRVLNDAIVACEECPRLRRHGRRVAREKRRAYRGEEYWGKPVPGFGDPEARLLVVGLAPAAHGGNRTGRVFTGDSSGEWLYEALHRFGFSSHPRSISRDDDLRLHGAWITAAARCAPPANRPTRHELDACRSYLVREIRILDRVRVVVALGRVGYEAWLKASGWWERLPPRVRPGFGHGAQSSLPDGTVLLCSFHPSRQNTNTGRLTKGMWHSIFRRARRIVDGLQGDSDSASPGNAERHGEPGADRESPRSTRESRDAQAAAPPRRNIRKSRGGGAEAPRGVKRRRARAG